MDLNQLKDKFNELNLDKQLTLEEIPEIDLYMDQLIQLFDNKFKDTKRTEEDKALTKTMINNYAKGKLFMSVKNKKYTKEHLVLISLIYNLKGALSIADIKTSLNDIVTKLENSEDYPVRELYKACLEQYDKDVKETQINIEEKNEIIEQHLSENTILEGEFEKNFILLNSLVNMSNIYRRMSEKLIDEYFVELLMKGK